MNLKEKVKELIDAALQENQSLFLIDFSVGADGTIKVIIDGDNGVSVEDCVSVSRAIEHNLDREEQDFSLEVTSCGIFSPLVNIRQYKKNVGREISVKTTENFVEGKLISADENQIVVQTQTREPKPVGKGKITITKEHIISLESIKEAKLIVKF